MALKHGFRGQLFDDDVPLYCTTTDGWVLDRTSGQWITAASLSAQMSTEGYIPTTDFLTPGVGGVEIGIPSTQWQDDHNEHEFWGSAVGGREWGDPGVVFPTNAGGGGSPTPPTIHGPYMVGDQKYWIDSAKCMVGFDVDTDEAPDIWMTGDQVCAESEINDETKMHISANLVAHGCSKLTCVLANGSGMTQAYIKANAPSEEDE